MADKTKLNALRAQYEALILMEDSDDGIFDFKEELLSSDEEAVLEFHFKILEDKNDEYLRRDLFVFFSDRNDKVKVAEFLYKKYKNGIEDPRLRADIIQLLGHLKSKYARELAVENMLDDSSDLRYRSIIVLGWIGTKIDLKVLNERLLTDPEPQLRGYAATAMRQIWFNHPKSKEEILKYINAAIPGEKEEKALEGMIITVQDLLKKKLGLKESKYGDVTGDMEVAKVKTITILNQM